MNDLFYLVYINVPYEGCWDDFELFLSKEDAEKYIEEQKQLEEVKAIPRDYLIKELKPK